MQKSFCVECRDVSVEKVELDVITVRKNIMQFHVRTSLGCLGLLASGLDARW
jgi:hypothetical protein